MSNGYSFRKLFTAAATAITLSCAPAFADAATQNKPAQTQKHQVKKTAAKKAPVKKKFVPHSPTGETCPSEDASAKRVWLRPSFDVSSTQQQTLLAETGFVIGRKSPDGVFTERTIQSVNEYRMLTGHGAFRESLTSADLKALRNFSSEVEKTMTHYNLPPDEAVTLLMATRHTSLDANTVFKKFFSAGKPSPIAAETWLALVALHGDKYGLSPYSKAIEKTKQGNTLSVSVTDPVLLQQILAMRDHPRLSVLLAAELNDKTPQAVYKSSLPALYKLAEQQQNLRLLGFDLDGEEHGGIQGPATEAALRKFTQLYTPAYATFGAILTEAGHAQEAYIRLFAELAQKDATNNGISTAAAAAIRLASLRTDADFGYMMELSSAESNFDPTAKAATSSATGLYQFTEDTWLHMIRRYGEKYGLGHLAELIEAKNDMYGTLVARVENPYARVIPPKNRGVQK